jgi:hypothetical protein
MWNGLIWLTTESSRRILTNTLMKLQEICWSDIGFWLLQIDPMACRYVAGQLGVCHLSALTQSSLLLHTTTILLPRTAQWSRPKSCTVFWHSGTAFHRILSRQPGPLPAKRVLTYLLQRYRCLSVCLCVTCGNVLVGSVSLFVSPVALVMRWTGL